MNSGQVYVTLKESKFLFHRWDNIVDVTIPSGARLECDCYMYTNGCHVWFTVMQDVGELKKGQSVDIAEDKVQDVFGVK